MSEEIGDLAVRVSLDNTGFQNGMSDVNRALRLTNSEFKANTSALGNNASEMDKLRLKASSLTTSISQQRDKVSILENAHRQSITTTGANSRATQDLEIRLNLARASLSNMSNTLLTTNTQIATMSSAWTRLGTSLTGIGGNLTSVGDKMTSIGKSMMLRVTAPIIAIGVASGKMASDVEESTNKVDVAFGNNAQSVKDFSETTLESFGIAKGSTLEMASLFGDMASGMGLNTEQASQMSIKLVGLAGDLASFKNIGISQAQTALKGIFTGEGESLKTLGVIMLDSTLKQFAMEKGIKRTYETMTQTEKVMLRYQYVLDKTKNSQGDFARTSDGTANSVRIFQESLKEFGAILGQQILPVVTPIIKKLGEMMQGFSKLNPNVIKTVLVVGTLTALVAPLLIIFGTLISALGTVTTFFGGMALSAGVASGATTALGLASGSAIAPVAGLGSAIWLAIAPIMPFIGILGALGVVIGGVALHHKKQTDEVKKTQKAYEDFNKVLTGGSVKELKDYEETLKFYQQTLVDLRVKMEEYQKAGNSMDYNNTKIQLEDYIETIKKEGFSYDENTGKIIELSKVQNRLNTKEQLDGITETIQKRVDESTKIVQLMERYTQLNAVKERTGAEDAELSNLAKELNRTYSDLKISIDKNGNAIIANVGLLGKKKEALEIDIQMIKENAYQQAKNAIYSEEIEIGKTKATITQIEARMKARDLEKKADTRGAERQTPQEEADAMAYLDAYLRLKAIKEQISSINVPQALSGGNDLDFKFGDSIPKEEKAKKSTNETFETGIEATSKYSKVLVELGQDLSKVDSKIKGIQNKIETSKAIGTTEELAKVTKEQNNLYQAQIEKVNSLKNAENILVDNKKKLIQEFKGNFGTLKNVDLSKWEEDDFNNFIEKTYKQSTTTDKLRAEELKKGQKYAQDTIKDLTALNNKIENVGDTLIDVKKEQLKSLRETQEQEQKLQEELLSKQIEGINKFNAVIIDALKERYSEQAKMLEDKNKKELEDLDKWKEESEKRINSVYDTKIKGIEDSSNAQIKALNAEIDALDKQKKQEDRNDKNTTDLKNINSLENAIQNEHNEYNKSELQKQLNKAMVDRQKTLNEQVTEDKKSDLNKQINILKESAEIQKKELELLKKAELDNIKDVFTAEKDSYNKRANELKIYYEQKLTNASLNAEAEKMIMDNNQIEIVALLNSYSDQYKLAGKTLGEKLVEGFKPQIEAIKAMISSVTSQMSALNTMQSVNVPMLNTNANTNQNSKPNTTTSTNNNTVNNHISITSPVAQTPSQQRVTMENTLRKLAFIS